MHHVVDIERRDVHLDRFGNLERQAFDLDLALERLQDAAIDDAGRAADETQLHRNAQRLRQIHFVEIDMQNVAVHRRPLQLLDDDVFAGQFRRFRADADEPLMGGGVNPLAQIQGRDRYRNGFAMIAVDDSGHAPLPAQPIDHALGRGRSFFTSQIDGFHAF